MDITRIKDYIQVLFYILLVISVFIFTINYAFVDWNDVSDNFVELTSELAEVISCEIDYKEFHYKGFCADREDIFEFLNNLSVQG